MWVIVLPVTVGLVVVWRWPERMAATAGDVRGESGRRVVEGEGMGFVGREEI